MAEPDDGSATLAELGAELADLLEDVLGPWVERCVAMRCEQSGTTFTPEVARAAAEAGDRCRSEVAPALRALLGADVDDQRSTPLSLLRDAVRYPTEVLAGAGVPEVVRDEFAERHDPADVYGLAPASFADVDESLTGPGIAWSAAKAFVHRVRHGAAG